WREGRGPEAKEMSNSEPFIQQNYFVPDVVPKAKAITDLGTVSVEVIGENARRSRLIVHNPNTVANIAICPAYDVDGNPLAAAFGGGSIVIVPLSSWILESPCYSAFNAIADDVSVGLTIW